MKPIILSENFRKMAVKSVAAIFLFAFVYMLLVIAAILLTVAFGYIGFKIVLFKFTMHTAFLAVGLVSIGVLTLIFLIKFIFQKQTRDLSHLTEINQKQEPQLFLMIDEIVREAGTDFPKKIYLSADVNAAVFYNSGFWSMFLPVRKNLQIGLGLVNSVTVVELRAILAHEFGHFSQKSMKVGSYVYNMNRVIYNMLYENDSFEKLTNKWAESNTIISIGVFIALKIMAGIQWILQKVYQVLNLTYMGLSREMEFHADEVAANVAGSGPLITALLRIDLASQAYQAVVDHYRENMAEPAKPQNMYPQQTFVMQHFAQQYELTCDNGLPQVSPHDVSRYNRSKLIITDQWASHPSNEDRVARLQQLDIQVGNEDNRPAWCIFQTQKHWQTLLTDKEFNTIEPSSPPASVPDEQFAAAFLEKGNKYRLNELYNGYYNDKHPGRIVLEDTIDQELFTGEETAILFGKNAVENIYEYLGLEGDMATLQAISNGGYSVKTFDYDGIKYSPKDCADLIARITVRLNDLNGWIKDHDTRIYQYFLQQEISTGRPQRLRSLYELFYHWDQITENTFAVYSDVWNAAVFMFHNTPAEQIKEKLDTLKSFENAFKTSIAKLLEEKEFQKQLTPETEKNFRTYISGDYAYFHETGYQSDELDVLFSAMSDYRTLISVTFLSVKKELLDYQASLTDSKVMPVSAATTAENP